MSGFELIVITAVIVAIAISGTPEQVYVAAFFAFLPPLYLWAFAHVTVYHWFPAAILLSVAFLKDRQRGGGAWRSLFD